jgi:hypothetical protein
MSEDSTRITVYVNQVDCDISIASDILRRVAKENDCANFKISKTDKVIDAFYEFMSLDSSEIDKIIREIQTIGCEKIICRSWFDNVGEEQFSTVINGKFESFESMESLEDYRKEASGEILAPTFNYGKEKENKTALIRFQVKAKRKREAIKIFFNEFIDIAREDLEKFQDSFIGLVKSKAHDIKWCGFKWKESKNWYEGPKALIYGLKFVTDQDDYIYLGFDLEGLDLHEGRSRDEDLENLIFVLSNIDGVKKTWIKFRPGAKTIKELYIYHPGMGDEPMVLRRPLSEDTEWPK